MCSLVCIPQQQLNVIHMQYVRPAGNVFFGVHFPTATERDPHAVPPAEGSTGRA